MRVYLAKWLGCSPVDLRDISGHEIAECLALMEEEARESEKAARRRR